MRYLSQTGLRRGGGKGHWANLASPAVLLENLNINESNL